MMNSISLRIGSRTGRLPPRTAFTLIELLVAIAIIAILAGLLTTAIAKAKTKAQGIACLGNVRQLALAWLLYAGDNNERLAYNFGGPTNRGIAPKSVYNCVNNIMSWELDPDSINDGYFLNRLEALEWWDLPASYHDGSANFTFADGHAQAHRWINKATQPPARPDAAALPFPVVPTQRADYDWVVQRTSTEFGPTLSKAQE